MSDKNNYASMSSILKRISVFAVCLCLNMFLCVFEETVTMNTRDLGDHLPDAVDQWMTKNRKQILVVTRWCTLLFLLFFVGDTGMLYCFQGRGFLTKYIKFRITILALMMLNSIVCLPVLS